MTTPRTEDRIDMLLEAYESLEKSIELIYDALDGTSHALHAKSYIIPHLRSWLDNDRHNTGITGYIDYLRNRDEEDDEEYNED